MCPATNVSNFKTSRQREREFIVKKSVTAAVIDDGRFHEFNHHSPSIFNITLLNFQIREIDTQF